MPIFEAVLLGALKSYPVEMAGEENAVADAPPSKAVNSSKSRSWIAMLPCGVLPVLWEKSGTGGLAGRFCCVKAADEDGADKA